MLEDAAKIRRVVLACGMVDYSRRLRLSQLIAVFLIILLG